MVFPATIGEYVSGLIEKLVKIDLLNFLTELGANYYPDQDLSFMPYFMELCDDENDGKFIVHHEKLIEFGVATSKDSFNMKTRLTKLSLVDGEDYITESTKITLSHGGSNTKHDYYLNPDSFKLCLMRAKKEKNQEIDVEKYARYYIFVEKVVKWYKTYQTGINARYLEMANSDIVDLKSEIKEERDAAAKEREVAAKEREVARLRYERMFGKLDELTETNEILIEKNEVLVEKVDDLTDEVKDGKKTINRVANTMGTLVSTVASRSAAKPSTDDRRTSFTLTMVASFTKSGVKFRCKYFKTVAKDMGGLVSQLTSGDFKATIQKLPGKHIVLFKTDEFPDQISLFDNVKKDYNALIDDMVLNAEAARNKHYTPIVDAIKSVKSTLKNRENRVWNLSNRSVALSSKEEKELKSKSNDIVVLTERLKELSETKQEMDKKYPKLFKKDIPVSWGQACFDYSLNRVISLSTIVNLFLNRVIVSRSGAIIDDDTEFEEITKIAKENEEKYRTSDEYKSITVIDDNTLPNYIRSSLGKYYRGLEPEDVKLAAIEYAEDAEKEGAVADAKPKKAKKAKKVKTTKKPKEAKVVEPATEAANAAAVEAEFEEEPF